MNKMIWDNEKVGPNVLPKIDLGDCDLYFMIEGFCRIFQDQLWDNESM